MLDDLVLFLAFIIIINNLNTLFLLRVDLLFNFIKFGLLDSLGLHLLLLATLLCEKGRGEFAHAFSWFVVSIVVEFTATFLVLFPLLAIVDLLLNLLILS